MLYVKIHIRIFFDLFDLITANTTSKTEMKKEANIGSPCLIPLFNLKYVVVFPSLIIQDFIHFIKFFPNPGFSNLWTKLTESKVFLCLVLNYFSRYLSLLIYQILIDLLHLQICFLNKLFDLVKLLKIKTFNFFWVMP